MMGADLGDDHGFKEHKMAREGRGFHYTRYPWLKLHHYSKFYILVGRDRFVLYLPFLEEILMENN